MSTKSTRFTPMTPAGGSGHIRKVIEYVVIGCAVAGLIACVVVLFVRSNDGDKGDTGNSHLKNNILVDVPTQNITLEGDAELIASFSPGDIALTAKVQVGDHARDDAPNAIDVFIESNTDTSRMIIHGPGSKPLKSTLMSQHPALTVYNGEQNVASNPASIGLVATSISEVGAVPPLLQFGATRSTSTDLMTGNYTALQTGDELGGLVWHTDDGIDLRTIGASVKAVTASDSSANTAVVDLVITATNQLLLESSIESGIMMQVNPDSHSILHDALIAFNQDRAELGYTGTGPLTVQPSAGTRSLKHAHLTTKTTDQKVVIGNEAAEQYITVSDKGTEVSGLGLSVGAILPAGQGFQIYAQPPTGEDALVRVASTHARAAVQVHASLDSNPGLDSCFQLGSKASTSALHPDNSWGMCIDTKYGQEFSPYLSFVWRSSDWAWPGSSGARGVFQLTPSGKAIVNGTLEFAKTTGGIVLPNYSGAPSTELRDYSAFNHAVTLTGAWASGLSEFYYSRIGTLVTITYGSVAETCTSASSIDTAVGTVPEHFRPLTYDVEFTVRMKDNGTFKFGLLTVLRTGQMRWYTDAAQSSFAGTGACELRAASVSYNV